MSPERHTEGFVRSDLSFGYHTEKLLQSDVGLAYLGGSPEEQEDYFEPSERVVYEQGYLPFQERGFLQRLDQCQW